MTPRSVIAGLVVAAGPECFDVIDVGCFDFQPAIEAVLAPRVRGEVFGALFLPFVPVTTRGGARPPGRWRLMGFARG
jgi:hypothetical protein